MPIITTRSNLEGAIFRNILRIVEEYQVSNSSISVQDTEKNITFPNYTLFLPLYGRNKTSNQGSRSTVSATMVIDFDATMSQGYKKCNEMHQALEDGLESEEDNLQTARLRYTGSEIVDFLPIDINGQQVLCKTVRFDLEVLL